MASSIVPFEKPPDFSFVKKRTSCYFTNIGEFCNERGSTIVHKSAHWIFMFKFIRPEFFDIFGVFVWIFFIGISSYALRTGEPVSRWALILSLSIGILGLIIDGSIVYRTYIKKK